MWLQGVIENNHGSPEFLCMSISIHAVIPPPHWVMCPTNFENKRVPALEQGLQNFHCMRKNVARQCSQPRQLEVDSAWHRVFAFLLEICQFWNSFRMKQENIHPSFRWGSLFFRWSTVFIELLRLVITKFFVRMYNT